MSVTPEVIGVNWPMAYAWLIAAQWIFNIGLGAWLYFRKADTDNSAAVAAVARDLAEFVLASKAANEDQNTRLTTLESTVQHLPTDAEIAHIREDVASTKARVEGMLQMLQRIEHQTNMIHHHMLSGRLS